MTRRRLFGISAGCLCAVLIGCGSSGSNGKGSGGQGGGAGATGGSAGSSSGGTSSGGTAAGGSSGAAAGGSSGAAAGGSSGASGAGGSGGTAAGGTGGAAPSQKLAIPTYWYPPSAYDTQLDSAGGTYVGFVIANVNSGPGTAAHANFQTMFNNERAAGIKVFGYVYTSYGARQLSAVEAAIDGWYKFYGIDGILFDEAPGTGWTAANKTYYKTLYNYVRAKTGANVHGTKVVLNPGAVTDEYAMSVSDIICDYEDQEAHYSGANFPSWTKNYPANRFWNVVHTSAGVSQMQADIQLAKSRNVGYIYVTTDSGGNPYDTLPATAYWTAELGAL